MISLLLLAALQAPCDPQPWLETLPPTLQASILWSADHEGGTFYDWDFGGDPDAGGGIFNTGGSEVVASIVGAPVHSGNHAASGWISNAFQAQNGSRAVRIMRWTDTHWGMGGQYFPNAAYYSCWYYFPHAYNPNKSAP